MVIRTGQILLCNIGGRLVFSKWWRDGKVLEETERRNQQLFSEQKSSPTISTVSLYLDIKGNGQESVENLTATDREFKPTLLLFLTTQFVFFFMKSFLFEGNCSTVIISQQTGE